MNARGIASLVLKLMGIFFLMGFSFTLSVSWWGLYMVRGSDISSLNWAINIATLVGMPLLYLIVSGLIIVKSEAIAKRLVPDEQATLSIGIDAGTFLPLAFCIVGLVLLTNAMPKVAQHVTDYSLNVRSMNKPYALYGQMAATTVQLVIGTVLFLQADGLAGFWLKRRGLGINSGSMISANEDKNDSI